MLDEARFRVTLRDNVDAAANLEFAEGPAASAAEDRAIRDALARRLDVATVTVTPRARVLDVCAGRGHLGEMLIQRSDARVTYVDLSASQLAELRRRQGSGAPACAGDRGIALPVVMRSRR